MGRQVMLSASQVLEVIDPVDPDNLSPAEPGVWVAKWAPVPVLGGDIEVLRRTPGVEIVVDEYESSDLPGWVAVDFAIKTDVS